MVHNGVCKNNLENGNCNEQFHQNGVHSTTLQKNIVSSNGLNNGYKLGSERLTSSNENKTRVGSAKVFL